MADQYNSAHTGAEIDQAVSDVQNNKEAWGTKELPTVTTADNGKFLRVASGAWAAAEIANANGGSF